MVDTPKTYLLDTNVLIHDPSALYRFNEHDVYVAMTVLEELDAIKKGVSEVARNARQASRFLDETIREASVGEIERGIPLSAVPRSGDAKPPRGRLFLQTRPLRAEAIAPLTTRSPDNTLLETALALEQMGESGSVILVSKDINLRIKARLLGIETEDYSSDKVLDDIDLLYSGIHELPADLWSRCETHRRSWQEEGVTFHEVPADTLQELHPNTCVHVAGEEPIELIALAAQEGRLVLRSARDHRIGRNAVWGITARNREQNFALNLLLDPDIEFVSLVGVAGTGKTLLALAAGLAQCMEMRRYREIVVTRVTVPLGEDIGFLPGTEEEKMTPWMGALMDNLEVLTETEEGGEWGRAVSADLIHHRIKIRSLSFMRGRTFLNRFVIIDEAQNLTAKQMKTLITRAGPGSKVVCLGNIAQIDTPYLSETTSGLTYVVDRFKAWAHSGHLVLSRGERSRLADYATRNL